MGNLGEKLLEDRIERCPFCGFEDGEVRFLPGGGRYYYVYCNCCECRGPTCPTKVKAVDAWNESFQELLAYIDRLEDKTAYDNESLEKLYGRPRGLRSDAVSVCPDDEPPTHDTFGNVKTDT